MFATHDTALELRWLSVKNVNGFDAIFDHSNRSAVRQIGAA